MTMIGPIPSPVRKPRKRQLQVGLGMCAVAVVFAIRKLTVTWLSIPENSDVDFWPLFFTSADADGFSVELAVLIWTPMVAGPAGALLCIIGLIQHAHARWKGR